MNQTLPEMNCRLFVFCIIFSSLLGLSWSSLTLAPSMQEVVRYVNESYFVTCSDDGNKEENPVKWTKGKSAPFTEKHHPHVTSMISGTALVFERINTADRGKYTCRANEQQISFELIVILPISFMETASVQTVQESRSGVIKCKVKGDPQPKIVWKFQGKDLNSTKYKYLNEGLKIPNVSLTDRGIYTCRAYQVSHLTSMFEEKHITVNVQHKPFFKKPVHAKVDQAYGYIGGEVNLTCEAIAEPAANFTWFRQHKRTVPGRIIQEDHRSILQLFIHNESVFGDYLCKATNELGILDQIISLQEGVKPPAPQKLTLRAANSDSLDVELVGPDMNATKLPQNMVPSAIRMQYRIKGSGDKWTDADFPELGDDGGAYTLAGLVNNKRYEIRAATRNLAGLSDFTPSVVYQTLRVHADQVKSGTLSYTVTLLHVSVASLLSLLATLL